jgi:hypothetical protein
MMRPETLGRGAKTVETAAPAAELARDRAITLFRANLPAEKNQELN